MSHFSASSVLSCPPVDPNFILLPSASVVFNPPDFKPVSLTLTNNKSDPVVFAIGINCDDPVGFKYYWAQPGCGVIQPGAKAEVSINAEEFRHNQEFDDSLTVYFTTDKTCVAANGLVNREAFGRSSTAKTQQHLKILFNL